MMKNSKKKRMLYGVLVMILLIIAFCCQYVNIVQTFFDESNLFIYVIYPTLKSIIRHMIHISLVLAWCMSIKSRILDKRIRNLMMSVGFLIILWLLIRVCKWDFVTSYERDLVRYLWYGYYIPIILLPLQGIFISDLVGRPEGYSSPGWMKWLYIPAVLLIFIVFSNDAHYLVFAFPDGIRLFNLIYRHEILYYIILLWVIILAVIFIVSLMKKSCVPGVEKYHKLPFVVLFGFVAVWFIHTLNLFPNDQTVLNCMLIILLLESQIQTGLIRSNTNYDELFGESTIAAQIMDQTYKKCYDSGLAMDVDIDLLKQSEGNSIRSGDFFLHSKPVSGGFVLWQDNISEINTILEQLQETKEQLGESYELKKAEIDLKKRKYMAEEKSRLYDRIAHEISPQLIKADSILDQSRKNPEHSKELLAQVCVISAYIKRLSNLLLVGEEKKEVPANELESCLRESLDNLRLANVLSFLDSKCEGMSKIVSVVKIYQLFEKVVEYLFGTMSALVVVLCCKSGEIRMRIQLGCNVNPNGVELPEFSVEGGVVTYEIQEEDIVIHVSLDEGGDIKC